METERVKSETTIVSSFMANGNTRGDRKTLDYLELGKEFLKIEVAKIVFMDETIKISETDYDPKYTVIIPYNKESNYLYKCRDKITNFNIITDNPAKDSLEFLMIMCHKTRWVKIATEMNPFGSHQWCWCDYGIAHIFKGDLELYRSAIKHLTEVKYNKVRIGSIWDPNRDYGIDPLRQILWAFAGGVVGGDTASFLAFDILMEKKCIEIIEAYKTLTWEVNIWYLIYKENKDLFSIYYCDHNPFLLLNY